MESNIKILTVFILMTLLLAWAPWLNEQELYDRILQEKGGIDGTVDKNGNTICDYKVNWLPFGRWVASCEGGYYVTFYGQIL